MIKPSLLLAAGCSWVAGKSIDCDPASVIFDYDHIEDPAVVEQYSFSALLQKQLGLDQLIILAEHGSNNDTQLKKIVEFINSNYDNYSSIFVLWGVTTVYRWEMYLSESDQVESVQHNRVRHKPDLTQQAKYYFSNYWNKDYELEKLGKNILLLNGYLNSLNIDHLFFNSFSSVTDIEFGIKNASPLHFYKIKESHNDMLSLLCQQTNIKVSTSSVPFLNLVNPEGTQYNTNSVTELQKQGLLDQATAHPTIKAHSMIANELYKYIKEQYERI